MIEILFIALLAVFAPMVGTIAGFGTSAIMISGLVVFSPLSFSSILLLVGVIHFAGSASKMFFFRKGLDIPFALGFAIPALFGSLVGAYFALMAPSDILSQLLGVFLIVYVSFSHFNPEFRMPKKPFLLGLGGAIAGLSAGLLGIAGSIRSAFFSAYHLSKRTFLAAAGTAGVIIDGARIATYLLSDVTLPHQLLWGFLVFLPAAALGTKIGKKVLVHVSERRFRMIVSVFLFIVGLRLIFFPV